MNLSLFFPQDNGFNVMKEEKIQLIKDISFTISIDNCLAPVHPVFPTIRTSLIFENRIELEMDLFALK